MNRLAFFTPALLPAFVLAVICAAWSLLPSQHVYTLEAFGADITLSRSPWTLLTALNGLGLGVLGSLAYLATLRGDVDKAVATAAKLAILVGAAFALVAAIAGVGLSGFSVALTVRVGLWVFVMDLACVGTRLAWQAGKPAASASACATA